MKLSILDLVPIPAGHTTKEAIDNTLELAKRAEDLGYERYWLAEHHNTNMLACSVPEILIGQVGRVTSKIRIGSGGIMLPNHSPLRVAESFHTLSSMFPGRVDLGLGRAPGTDPLTATAIRRSRAGAEDFPDQLVELFGYLYGKFPEDHPFRNIIAAPQNGEEIPIYILGSSNFGAQVAAFYGLGYAYAHHINPAYAMEALSLYEESFQASDFRTEPHGILAVSAICAPTEEEAEELAASARLAISRIAQGKSHYPFPSVEEATSYEFSPAEKSFLEANRSRLQVGSPNQIKEKILTMKKETGADEVMITSLIHDSEKRIRSYELIAEAFSLSAVS